MYVPKSLKEFRMLPLVVEGESKEIRYLGKGLVCIKLKPTIYSYTHNRCGTLPGTEKLRFEATRILVEELKKHNVDHAYKAFKNGYIVADLLRMSAGCSFKPDDLSEVEFMNLPVAPPIEVVVKSRHVGTPKHRYFNLESYPIRSTHELYDGTIITPESTYPEAIVRFDWRNPMHDPSGNRLADEVLTEQMADWYININNARVTALKAYSVLQRFLEQHNIDLWDICFFISEDGNTVFSEVSQDCGRYRTFANHSSLDKDVWRGGGSSEHVAQKWKEFLKQIQYTNN